MPYINLQIATFSLKLAEKRVQEATCLIHILPKSILSKSPRAINNYVINFFYTNEVLFIVENGHVETNVSYYHG